MREMLFSRLPPLPYMPDLRHLNWCFPLTNTDYYSMKTLIKDAAAIYYEEAPAPVFERSAPQQFTGSSHLETTSHQTHRR